ncbi:MAG: biliverdin-producing heme oxygenase [Sediminibacterium sp.]
MNTSFLDRLVERTAEWQTRLGQNMLYINLLGENVTLSDYKKYLCSLYGFVSGFETYIYPELDQLILNLEERKKTKYITNDLSHLGQKVTEIEPMPESYFKSMYADPYAALGALYVLESSTLGGRLIQEHLHSKLKGGVVSKLNYFDARGEKAEPMWNSFRKIFCTIAEASDKQENIIDGALRTLRLLDQLMTDESLKK